MSEVSSVSPKPTTSSWFSLASSAIANAIETITGEEKTQQEGMKWRSFFFFFSLVCRFANGIFASLYCIRDILLTDY